MFVVRSEQLVLEVLITVVPPRRALIFITCLAWWIPIAEVVPLCTARCLTWVCMRCAVRKCPSKLASRTLLFRPLLQRKEGNDEVHAGLTMSHGPYELVTY